MRIGIDARFYGSLGKGLGRYTERLIQELEKIDCEDEFFVFLRKENFQEYIPRSSRFTKVLADFPWYSWQEQIFFPRLLLQYELDLVHFPHFNVPLFYRRAFVVTIHDLILWHYPTVKASELSPFLYWGKYWMYRLVIGSAVRRARTVFTVSRFTQADLESVYPSIANKICMTHEAADMEVSTLSPDDEQLLFQRIGLTFHGKGRPYVLYVGNAYPHKNLQLLLDVAGRLPEKQFVCVGREDYFYREFKKQVEQQKITNILFTGFVSDKFLPVLYREAESYFFPSLYEGFGLPALEALQFGTPVVLARAGALPEIVGEAGIFFDPKNVEEVVKKVKLIGENTALRERMILMGKKRIQDFSWSRMATETYKEYHRNEG